MNDAHAHDWRAFEAMLTRGQAEQNRLDQHCDMFRIHWARPDIVSDEHDIEVAKWQQHRLHQRDSGWHWGKVGKRADEGWEWKAP